MVLNKLANHYKKAQIITHNDLDGYGAGAILVKTLVTLGFDIDNIKVTNTDYVNPFPVDEDYDFVLLSDISISNDKDAQKIINFVNRTNKLLFWFDHHKTSIDISEEYLKLKSIPGIRDTNACGAMLCWIFYQIICRYSKPVTGSLQEVITELKNVNVSEIMNSPNRGIWNNSHNNQSTLFVKTPFGIILTDDYDRFVLSDQRSKYYVEAFSNYPKFKRNCKSDYFQNNYMNTVDLDCFKYIQHGKKIFLWKRIIFLNTLKYAGFIASFPIEAMRDIEMICINSPTKGSLFFGNCLGNNTDKYIQYNYACVYYNKGEKFTASIYCAEPDKTPNSIRQIGRIYDAADICKRFDGGGHPGAAGFVTAKMDFCNVKPLPTALKMQIDEEIEMLYEEMSD